MLSPQLQRRLAQRPQNDWPSKSVYAAPLAPPRRYYVVRRDPRTGRSFRVLVQPPPPPPPLRKPPRRVARPAPVRKVAPDPLSRLVPFLPRNVDIERAAQKLNQQVLAPVAANPIVSTFLTIAQILGGGGPSLENDAACAPGNPRYPGCATAFGGDVELGMKLGLSREAAEAVVAAGPGAYGGGRAFDPEGLRQQLK